jgi:hypothetical protein
VLAGLPAAAPAQPSPSPQVTIAKTCSSSYTRATIGGEQKCLRRGQFCARRYRKQYRRYGFRCVKRDVRGNYHLT